MKRIRITVHLAAHRGKWLFFIITIVLLILLVSVHVVGNDTPPIDLATWGVTFTKSHAQYLGLDWKKTYIEILDDLKVRWLRIGVHWDEIEPEPGTFAFDDIRWQLDEAHRSGARVLLAIGRKLPRWPECRAPQWALDLPRESQEVRTLIMLRKVVEEFADHPAIWAWQLENEPLFSFGECLPPDRSFYQQEITLLRSLDTKPIVGTDSGELSLWWQMSSMVDILGVSVYHSTYNWLWGYARYPFAPALYARKARLVGVRVPRIIVSEVQMEPWATGDIRSMSVEEQFRSFTIDDFYKNIKFVKKTGFDTFYLWGVEWWAWMRERHNDPRFWNAAKEVFKS